MNHIHPRLNFIVWTPLHTPTPLHPLMKAGGWKFSKIGYNGRESGKFLLEMGGSREFRWGGDGKKSLDIVDRGVLTPLFHEKPLILPIPPFWSVFHHPQLPCHLQPHFHCSFCFHVSLAHHIWCAILVNDNLDLHMLTLGSLVPEGPWCVFYAIRHQVYWGLTQTI